MLAGDYVAVLPWCVLSVCLFTLRTYHVSVHVCTVDDHIHSIIDLEIWRHNCPLPPVAKAMYVRLSHLFDGDRSL